MNPIPSTPLTLEIARRVVWFEPPERALANPVQFMAYAMTYATHEDMQVIRRYVSDDEFREALDRAPPGIIDARSWAYWNCKMGRYPAPPLPRRTLGDLAVEPESWPPRCGATGGVDHGQPLSAEEVQEQARARWQQMRQQDSQLDAEEIRRRAQEEWRARFGSKEEKD